MRIVVEQAALAAATARVAGVIEARNIAPILSCMLVEATPDGEVWLTGAAADIEVKARMGATVLDDGMVAVPAAELAEIARSAPKGAEIHLTLGTTDNRLQIAFGRRHYQLPTLPGSDFPGFKYRPDQDELTVPAAELAGLLGRVHFAQSTEETRYYLNGTALQIVAVDGQAMLRVVATDGFRLALDECPAPVGSSMKAVIIPRKAVAEIRRMLEGLAGQVLVRTGPNGVAVRSDDIRLSSKIIDGHFPDYERVIPRSWTREVEIDRAALAAAVKGVALISREKARMVRFTLDGPVLTLSVRNTEAGEAREEIEIDHAGDPIEAAFNSRYVLDALDQSEGKSVVLRLGDTGLDPVRLDPHPADTTASGALCVLMPARV